MTKKSGSRFDDLFGAARSNRPKQEVKTTEEKASTEKSKSKSTDSNYIRTTLYLPKQLHKKLKSAAADEEREMSDIAATAIAEYLEEHRGKHI